MNTAKTAKSVIDSASASVLPSRFKVRHQQMKCASSEVDVRTFNMVMDHERKVVWFYTLEDYDPAGHIYCHHYEDEESKGFGGRTIVFNIGKSGQYHAAGPWHSNSDSLFEHTGVDLRNKHLTFVCVARHRVFEQNDTILEDILYIDKLPTLGKFDRGKEIAQKLADELKVPVCRYSESTGGSSCGYEYPTGTVWTDWSAYFEKETRRG